MDHYIPIKAIFRTPFINIRFQKEQGINRVKYSSTLFSTLSIIYLLMPLFMIGSMSLKNWLEITLIAGPIGFLFFRVIFLVIPSLNIHRGLVSKYHSS